MSYDNPNFTIITPGGCNSFCSFCTDPFKRKPAPEYLANLADVLLTQLPAHMRQCSISGGEPTLSPQLESILMMVKTSGHFDKVVLTTNGARLPQFVPLFKKTVHHLNVSRHGIGYEANTKVFGTRGIVTDEDLKAAAFELNKAGIDVNLNHVYTKDSALTVDYVLDYIAYAKSVGATSVSFRYDQNENTLEPTYLEKLFSEWNVVRAGGCPVCRNHTVLVAGFPVVFKASFAEPSKAIDDVYELIYHITGKLTTDWEGQRDYTSDIAQAYVRDFAVNPHKQHEVVTHTVAAPTPHVRGQKAVARPQVVSPDKGAQSAAEKAIASTPMTGHLPGHVVKNQVIDVGGGCGYGGGCGSSNRAVPDNRVAASVGGGCGYGGGCGASEKPVTFVRPPKTKSLAARTVTSSVGGGCGVTAREPFEAKDTGGGCGGGGFGFGGGCGK
jgi:organic radical activating enzyme